MPTGLSSGSAASPQEVHCSTEVLKPYRRTNVVEGQLQPSPKFEETNKREADLGRESPEES